MTVLGRKLVNGPNNRSQGMSARRSPIICGTGGRPPAADASSSVRKRPQEVFRGQCRIASIVRHALERAGIDSPRKGAHQFRHALACQMLKQGASLPEIGDLLRHRSPQTTAIYAKVDLASLGALALPWPGGAL